MKSAIYCLLLFFVLVSSVQAVTLQWDRYDSIDPIIFEIYESTDQEIWFLVKGDIPITNTTYTFPDPAITTTYAMKAVNTATGEKSLFSDITEQCIFRVAEPEPVDPPIIEPVDPPPPDPEPVPVPIITIDPEPEIQPIDDEVDDTLGMIRLVDCGNTKDVHELKLCGDINNDPYLMVESTKDVSNYIVSIDYIEEFVEPYENNELFYNLLELKYGTNTFIINSDDDSITFAIRKSIEGEGYKYEIMVGDDDRFIDPLIIYLPVPQNDSGGGCFISTIF